MFWGFTKPRCINFENISAHHQGASYQANLAINVKR